MVKLSQPHLFWAGGVTQHLCENIVHELNLYPVSRRHKCASTIAAREKIIAKSRWTVLDHVDPSDVNSEIDQDALEDNTDYGHNKQMSASIYRYFMLADDAKQEEMQVTISPHVLIMWQKLIAQDRKRKLHDLGDALLHALSDILCGATKYRQLIPTSISLHNN